MYIIDPDGVYNIDNDTETVIITLDDTTHIKEIPFTAGSGSFRETEEMTDDGISYKLELNLKIPKSIPGDNLNIRSLLNKRVLIGWSDNNDTNWISGYNYGKFYDVVRDKNSGNNYSDFNSEAIKISADLDQPSKLISGFDNV